jgi:hypothetical protein
MNYKDIYTVDTFEEAEQFRYEHNDQPVEVGTAVAYDQHIVGMPGSKPSEREKCIMMCFEGIYFQQDV